MATKTTKQVKAVKTPRRKAGDMFANPKRKTVDNDDLTIVVRETNFGMTLRYELVQHFGNTSGEDRLMSSQSQLDKEGLMEDAKELARKLNVPLVEVK